MDPQKAFEAFATAGPFIVQTGQGQMHLYELTDTAMAHLKQSNKRSDVITLAKRYIKAMEAVTELEKALEVFPGASESAKVSNTCVPQAKPAAQITNAMVPYVNVAPPSAARKAYMQEVGLDFSYFVSGLSNFRNSFLYKMYKRAFLLWFQFLLLAPLFILVAYGFHFMGATVYVASHPALGIHAVFALFKALPGLAANSTQEMGEQMYVELRDISISMKEAMWR